MKRLLISGGAGFVGSRLALLYKRDFPALEITAFDNLRRRGSELNLPLFKKHGIRFVHGDIRSPSDFEELGSHPYDLFIEASAEPSVLAGVDGSSPLYSIQTNLLGTLNCLEFARKRTGAFVFLSTSRVYSIEALRGIALHEGESRFELATQQTTAGLTSKGISEGFPTDRARSIYGSTKLASELFVQEYAEQYQLPGVINRCGVIAGAGQFGKVDQGVFTLWVANHFFGKPLKYTGFGGTGRQVRDLLHPNDLYRLIQDQVSVIHQCKGKVYNVGGGLEGSTSLAELTEVCQTVSGKTIEITKDSTSSKVDIPFFVTDYSRAEEEFGWSPRLGVKDIVEDIHSWIQQNSSELEGIFR